MEFLQPRSLAEAIAAKAEHPAAVPIAGGTDVMVEINFDARRPEALLDLNRVRELTSWRRSNGQVRLGAGVTYTRLIDELGDLLPGLAMAARTVGSPQIRNRGTVGGNLGAASPAGDCHPPLLATGAAVQVASVRGTRTIPLHGGGAYGEGSGRVASANRAARSRLLRSSRHGAQRPVRSAPISSLPATAPSSARSPEAASKAPWSRRRRR